MTDNTALTVTASQKKTLKAQAHALNPVVFIGDKGLTPSVVKEIDMNLNAHGLIKVRVTGDEREKRLEYSQTICQETGSALIQHIGKVLVLFRPKTEPVEKTKSASWSKSAKLRQTKRQFTSKN